MTGGAPILGNHQIVVVPVKWRKWFRISQRRGTQTYTNSSWLNLAYGVYEPGSAKYNQVSPLFRRDLLVVRRMFSHESASHTGSDVFSFQRGIYVRWYHIVTYVGLDQLWWRNIIYIRSFYGRYPQSIGFIHQPTSLGCVPPCKRIAR